MCTYSIKVSEDRNHGYVSLHCILIREQKKQRAEQNRKYIDISSSVSFLFAYCIIQPFYLGILKYSEQKCMQQGCPTIEAYGFLPGHHMTGHPGSSLLNALPPTPNPYSALHAWQAQLRTRYNPSLSENGLFCTPIEGGAKIWPQDNRWTTPTKPHMSSFCTRENEKARELLTQSRFPKSCSRLFLIFGWPRRAGSLQRGAPCPPQCKKSPFEGFLWASALSVGHLIKQPQPIYTRVAKVPPGPAPPVIIGTRGCPHQGLPTQPPSPLSSHFWAKFAPHMRNRVL